MEKGGMGKPQAENYKVCLLVLRKVMRKQLLTPAPSAAFLVWWESKEASALFHDRVVRTILLLIFKILIII